MSYPLSPELAADTSRFPLWDPQVPFPAYGEMPDLPVVTHVIVEQAQPGGYHYLHETSLAWHKGKLYLGWANHPTQEVNTEGELVRGTRSADGLTWEPAETWAAAPVTGGASFNHPVIFSDGDTLWGFFCRWEDSLPRSEIFTFDEEARTWQPVGAHIPGYLPFRPPVRQPDGSWIMAGELHWWEAAVSLSHGADLTAWDVVQIPRPESIQLLFPETALLERGASLVALTRPRGVPTAPVSVSEDCGRTWTPLVLSNFPLAESKPWCGKLSTGQQYLITDNLEEGRALLSIAVTRPGESAFCRVFKLRHQQYPKVRLFGGWGDGSRVGMPTEWSYPSALEHEGRLYVAYTQGKEDCVLSIIPLSALAV